MRLPRTSARAAPRAARNSNFFFCRVGRRRRGPPRCRRLAAHQRRERVGLRRSRCWWWLWWWWRMWWRCWLLFCRRLLAVLLRILGRVVDDHAKLAGTQVAWHEAQTHDALLPAGEQADHRLLQRGGARLQLLLERLDAAASPLLARAIRLPPSPLALARRPAQLELFRAQPAPSCSMTSHSTHQLLASPFARPTPSL